MPVPDPFRPLEDPADPITRSWGRARDDEVRAALDALPDRPALTALVADALAAGEEGVPRSAGGRTFALHRRPGAEHPVLEVTDPDGTTRPLLDPQALDTSGATVLDAWYPGPDGRRVAVALSEPGHASRLRILDAATGALLEGPVDRTALSPVAWLPGEDELVWVRQERPGSRFHRRVRRHRVGTDPAGDLPLPGPGLDPDAPDGDPTLYFGLHASPDGRWLVVDAAAGTAPGDGLWVADLADPRAPAVRVLHPGDGVRARARVAADGRLWIVTTLDAPRGRLCVADPRRPEPEHWRTLVGEVDGTVLDAARLVGPPTGGTAVLLRTRDGVAELHRHDPVDGHPLGPLPLPDAGTVTGLAPVPGTDRLAVGWTATTVAPRLLHADVRTGTITPASPTTPGPATTTSLPGRRVLLTRQPGGPGPRPTVLTGYGGFGHVAGPAYSALAAAWVAAGGVWARAVLRGGGEDGAPGHDAGRGAHLLAGTDDLLAAADALVADGVTTPDRLALLGVSHGGLRVAQALTTDGAADRFAAAVAVSPLADLVRSEHLGLGRAWRAEYGRADDPTEHTWLLAGSPYHRVRPGRAVPRVLVTASDADTRVDAAHARKLVAALQDVAPPGTVLYRRETDTGHGPRATTRTAAHAVDVLAFLAAATGLGPVAGPG